MAKPNFLILGAQRCGTTSLWNYLQHCPQVAAAVSKDTLFMEAPGNKIYDYCEAGTPIKETRFFTCFYDTENINSYHDFFVDGKKGFEASVEYFHIEHVAHSIKYAYGKNGLKFIVMLRDPTARAWSHYWHELTFNQCESLPFMEAIKRKLKTVTDYYHHAYLLTGHYAEHLRRWFKLFGRNNFLIIQSEHFYKHTDFWFKNVQMFLGLDPVVELNYYPNISINHRYPPIDGKTKSYLDDYFKPHNEALYELLDKD